VASPNLKFLDKKARTFYQFCQDEGYRKGSLQIISTLIPLSHGRGSIERIEKPVNSEMKNLTVNAIQVTEKKTLERDLKTVI